MTDMTTKTQSIKDFAQRLKLSAVQERLEEIVNNAQQKQVSYHQFAHDILKAEVDHRQVKDLQRRLKLAKLPLKHDLKEYDHTVMNGLSKQHMEQLKECNWLEQNFNIILMGPSGTGKTFIAAGLCHQAVNNGFRAYFRDMDQICQVLKMKDITRTAKNEYNKLMKAHLLVIDDIMMFPLEKTVAVGLFNLINYLHQRASFIITTNKSPEEWVKMLDDEVLATAILDRLLHKCEVVKLSSKSYRIKNRKTIF